MAQEWWTSDPVAQPAPVGGAPAARPGGVLTAPPKRVDPFKVRDQELQEESAARAREDQERQRKMDTQGSVDQGKAAGFLLRALQANDAYEAQDIDARSLVGQQMSELTPGILNSLPESIGNSPRRQVSDANQDEFVAATLRYESGAAIPPEELAAQRRRYFPMPGDGEDVLKAKARLRTTAIEALKQSSGPLADPTLTKFAGMGKTEQAPEAEPFLGITGTVTDTSEAAPPAPAPAPPPPTGAPVDGNSSIGQQLAAGLGDVIEGGFNNTAGIVVNPIGRTIYEMTGYGGQEYNGGQIIRNALGLPEGDPRISPYTEAASGGLGMAGAARTAATHAPGVIGNALATMGSTPIRDTGAAVSSVLGGQGVAALGGGPLAQTVGQVAGGALGYASPNLMTGVRGLGGAGRPPPDLNPEVIAAGERQNIPVRLPDASPSARNQMAVAEAAPYSGPMVKRAMNSDRDAMVSRVREQGGEGAPLTENYALGQRVQDAGSRYIDRTRQQKNAKYTDAEQLAGGQRINPQNAIAEVDRNIAQLEASGANNNAATIGYLKGLREDLAKPEGFSITEFQGLRSGAGKKIKGDQALTVSDADRRLNSVVKAFNADAKEQLPPQASDALQNADYFYAQRQDYIKKVLQPFVGTPGRPMSPERAGEAFRGITSNKANHDNLKRFLDEASPEEIADFRATIAESLVTGPKGEVGAAALATNIAKTPRNIRALVFGRDGARALDDIQLLATEKGNTTSGLNNSKSGVVGAAGKIGMRGLLTGVFGLSAGGPAGMVALPIATEIAASLGQARTARLLLNPNFTKWLKDTTEVSSPTVVSNHLKKLTEVAARSPVIANDARSLQQALVEAFKVSPGRAAAETDDVERGRRKPPQQ